jgi:hypothetical protein
VLVSREGVAKLTDFGNTTLERYALQFTGTNGGFNFSLRWAASIVHNQFESLYHDFLLSGRRQNCWVGLVYTARRRTCMRLGW